MTDREAMLALKAGDRDAMRPLVERHQLRALRIAFQITRDRGTAEEVVADAYVSVFRAAKRYDPAGEFQPWFTLIVVNRAISVARRADRYRQLLALLPRGLDEDHPESVAEEHETQRILAAALSGLKARQRAVLALRYYADLDEREIAATLGWPLGTVKSELHRGRHALREQLERDHSWRGLADVGG